MVNEQIELTQNSIFNGQPISSISDLITLIDISLVNILNEVIDKQDTIFMIAEGTPKPSDDI